MDKKYFLIVGLLLGFILFLPSVLAHMPGEQHSIFEWTSLQHIITFVIAVIVIIIGFMAASKTKNQSINYIVAGIAAIGLVHFTEMLADSFEVISLSADSIDTIDHVLTIVGLILIGYGFYRIKK